MAYFQLLLLFTWNHHACRDHFGRKIQRGR